MPPVTTSPLPPMGAAPAAPAPAAPALPPGPAARAAALGQSAAPPVAPAAPNVPPAQHLFGAGAGFFGPGRMVGGPREAFLAIHWFTHLSQGTDPAVIFLFLDYYRDAGWLGEGEYQWLERLAHGLANRRDNAKWTDFGMDSGRLAKHHLRNLRFLDKLFGATLQYGEAQYLQQTLDTLLQEE